MKIIVMIMVIFVFGCGHAWIIEQNEHGGVLGYKNFRSDESRDKALRKLVHCADAKSIRDRYVDPGSTTALVPMQTTNYVSGNYYGSGIGNYGSYSGTVSGMSYVPMQVDNSYRELTYQCESSLKTTEDISQVINGNVSLNKTCGKVNCSKVKNKFSKAEQQKHSCESSCGMMVYNNELKVGETYASCVEKTCK